MKKIILSVALVGLFLTSCRKETIAPTEPIATTNISECEKNHTGTLRVVNSTTESYYIYIENVYVVKVDPWSIAYYENVPSSSGLEIKAINVNDYNDINVVTLDFYDCTTSQAEI